MTEEKPFEFAEIQSVNGWGALTHRVAIGACDLSTPIPFREAQEKLEEINKKLSKIAVPKEALEKEKKEKEALQKRCEELETQVMGLEEELDVTSSKARGDIQSLKSAAEKMAEVLKKERDFDNRGIDEGKSSRLFNQESVRHFNQIRNLRKEALTEWEKITKENL